MDSNKLTIVDLFNKWKTEAWQNIEMGLYICLPVLIVWAFLLINIYTFVLGFDGFKTIGLYLYASLICAIGNANEIIYSNHSAGEIVSSLHLSVLISAFTFATVALLIFIACFLVIVFTPLNPIARLKKKLAQIENDRFIRGSQISPSSVVFKQQKDNEGYLPLGVALVDDDEFERIMSDTQEGKDSRPEFKKIYNRNDSIPEMIKKTVRLSKGLFSDIQKISSEIKEDASLFPELFKIHGIDSYMEKMYSRTVKLAMNNETAGVLFLGSNGAGKGMFLKVIVHNLLKRKVRCIVVDPKGDEYYPVFFNKEAGDVNINICDKNNMNFFWEPMSEIKSITDIPMLAKLIVPVNPNSKAPFFDNGARELVTAGLTYVLLAGSKTLSELSDLFGNTPDVISEKLSSVPGCSDAIKHLKNGDILSTLSTHIFWIKYLPKNKTGKSFDINEWILNGTGSIYLPFRSDLRPILGGYYNLFLNVLVERTLSAKSDINRRLAFIADEFPELGKVEPIMRMINVGRSKGFMTFFGGQSESQFTDIYGESGRETLFAVKNKIIMNLSNNSSSEYFSKFFNDRENFNTEKSMTDKADAPGGTGSNSVQTSSKAKLERTIIPSEFTMLPNFQAYVYQPGQHITKLYYPIVVMPPNPDVPEFEQRDDLNINHLYEQYFEMQKGKSTQIKAKKEEIIKQVEESTMTYDDYDM